VAGAIDLDPILGPNLVAHQVCGDVSEVDARMMGIAIGCVSRPLGPEIARTFRIIVCWCGFSFFEADSCMKLANGVRDVVATLRWSRGLTRRDPRDRRLRLSLACDSRQLSA